MNRISKFLVLCAALGLTVPVAAWGQTSRVEGMALQGDYIKDYSGIYTYLSQVPNVGNLIYGELGSDFASTDDRAVGGVLGNLWDGRFGTWGIHLREQTPNLGQGDGTAAGSPGQLGSDPNSHQNESFDLMWGRKFGTSSLGLRFNRSFHSQEFDNFALVNISSLEYDYPTAGGSAAAANLSRNITGLGIGWGMELSPTSMIETSLLYQTRTFQIVDTTGATTEEDGPTTYQLAARAWWQWQPNVVVVPVFKWYSYDLSTAAPGGTAENTLSGWQIGTAGNWTLGSNDLFVLGVTFAQNKIEQDAPVLGVNTPFFGFVSEIGETRETFMPMVFAALETHVNNWLTLRFGANKGAWHKIEIEEPGTPTKFEVSDSPFNMSIGSGVKIGTLQFDAVVNDAFPRNGLYLFSGATTSSLFPKVSATYSF